MVLVIGIRILLFWTRKPGDMATIATRAVAVFFPKALPVSRDEQVQNLVHHGVILAVDRVPLRHFLMVLIPRFGQIYPWFQHYVFKWVLHDSLPFMS